MFHRVRLLLDTSMIVVNAFRDDEVRVEMVFSSGKGCTISSTEPQPASA
jgi:hypothetical protein